MSGVTLASLTERLALADELLAGRAEMLDPQDLPGRYGRAVKAVDHLLQVIGCEAVLGGGWPCGGTATSGASPRTSTSRSRRIASTSSCAPPPSPPSTCCRCNLVA